MRKPVVLLCIVFCLIAVASDAQRVTKAEQNRYMEAFDLSEKARKLWKREQYIEAEKLFYQSNNLQPLWYSSGLRILGDLKLEQGDINGAKRAYKTLIESVKSYPGNLVSGVGEWSYVSRESVLRLLHQEVAFSNFGKGDINYALENYLAALRIGGPNDLSFYASLTALFAQDASALREIIEIVNRGPEKYKGHAILSDAFLDIVTKNYSEAIKKLERLDEGKRLFKNSKIYASMALCLVHAFNKDVPQSEIALKDHLKDLQVSKDFPFVDYTKGLNALTQGRFEDAKNHFTEELKPRNRMISTALYTFRSLAPHMSYVGRAEAYTGLKEYSLARQDFERALLYKPDYEPAQMGLAKLEGKIITERKTDKEPPVITLTEPSVTRGLKVSSAGFDVTFRGIAKDPAGLKSVNINGTDVYAQENGNFWGNITLKEGMNNVVIKATDIAGNTGMLEVQIEKVAAQKQEEIIPVVAKEAKNYAMIIASQSYDDPSIPSLENPVTDAVKLKFALKNNYNFNEDNISILFNPAIVDLKKKFNELIEAVQPEDNVIIFYAGHGIWVDKEKKGYWLLADAKRNDANTWLPNKTVLELIAKVPSRHTLLITDACFSGGVFKTRSLGADAPQAMREMSEKISRVAITSGNDTEVPDESVFMKYLVKALSENKDKYLTAQKMFINHIIEAVMNETKTEPRYGTLELAGHVGGDFIFVKK